MTCSTLSASSERCPRERETFLEQYRRAVDTARDPAGWKHLRRFCGCGAMRAVAEAEPGYYESRDLARAGASAAALLDEALQRHRRRVTYQPWLEERALRQMGGLPAAALDVLATIMARICEDPYDQARASSRLWSLVRRRTSWAAWCRCERLQPG